jgi:hypothetical protein
MRLVTDRGYSSCGLSKPDPREKQLSESPSMLVLVMPERCTVDFAPQPRLEADCSAVSEDDPLRWPAYALDAWRLSCLERAEVRFFEYSTQASDVQERV